MKLPRKITLKVAVSALLLAGGHATQTQAADDAYSSQAAPPRFTPGVENYPPPPPGGWQGVIDSIDKQESVTREQALTGQVPQPGGSSQLQQSQDMPGYGAPAYDTTGRQQPQVMPGTSVTGFGSPQVQQTVSGSGDLVSLGG